MDYDLLIVGNGFDIGCGFHTAYNDFLEYKLSHGIRDPLIAFFLEAYDKDYILNYEWNGFENLLCQYLQFLDYCFKNEDNIEWSFSEKKYDSAGVLISQFYNWKIKDVSKLPNSIFSILCLSSNPLGKGVSISTDDKFLLPFAGINAYPNVKELYFKVYIRATQANSTREFVLNTLLQKLDYELRELENELKEYIRIVTNGKVSGPSAFADNRPKLLASFNYSLTAQNLYNLDDSNVAYIHGNVLTDVVLGVEPMMIHGQSFDEESDFIKFFKRFRRIYKNCNRDFNAKIVNQLTPDSLIAIYGHSLDLSDKSILKPIFENRYKRYDIYCYGDVVSYKLKLAKLIGLDLLNDLDQNGKIQYILVK